MLETSQLKVIIRREMLDASRDSALFWMLGLLLLAAWTALLTGGLALRAEVTDYEAAKAVLLSLGKSIEQMQSPLFHPLRLLRGTVEQIEILGAVIAILIGFRAALSERGNQTIGLVLTRPLSTRQFLLGKLLGGLILLSSGLGFVFLTTTVLLPVVTGLDLNLSDWGRVALAWGCSVFYTLSFFLVSFLGTLHLRRPTQALLYAFCLWLLLVLIAPQIGDTLDPDNQIAGGFFRQLQVDKATQVALMQHFSGFEAIRTGIEAISLTKHFERFCFAFLEVKDTFAGQPLGSLMTEKFGDLLTILLTSSALFSLTLVLPFRPKLRSPS